jgi:predicted dehydrogenase
MPDRTSRPRIGCVGLGWIGRHRLNALLEAGIADVVAIADADATARDQAHALVPSAAVGSSFDDTLAHHVDAVVLATPSGMHAAQSIAALEAGVAVFCQKPLGRHATEVHDVIAAARHANRLLGVDLSYRHTEGLRRLRDLVRDGAVGEVYAMDLTFHNAYGPDKPWFYDVAQSGGGCLLDLGVHLVDFLHWTLDAPVSRAAGRLFAGGRRLSAGQPQVEDFALGDIELATGATARVACSWKLSAGCDAQIGISVFGTEGGLGFRNVNGSFYDFVAERYRGTHTERLCEPPDAWGGRAIVAWAQQLSRSQAFDPSIAIVERTATTLDQLYGRDTRGLGTCGFTLTESTRRTRGPTSTVET